MRRHSNAILSGGLQLGLSGPCNVDCEIISAESSGHVPPDLNRDGEVSDWWVDLGPLEVFEVNGVPLGVVVGVRVKTRSDPSYQVNFKVPVPLRDCDKSNVTLNGVE